MVVRPKTSQGGPRPSPTKTDSAVELNEQLVKMSLEINPALRDGKSTNEVLGNLRREAEPERGRSTAFVGAKVPLKERRRGAIAFFFEQKQEDLETELADLEARLKVLSEEKAQIQKRVIGELADFIVMVSPTETPEAREVIRSFKVLLGKLNIGEADLWAQVKARSR